MPLSLVGGGALVVNLSCAVLLTRFRAHSGSLTRAAFLSARNDVIANVATIAAGALTAYTLSAWPDLIVGLGIVAMNSSAAREVWKDRPARAQGSPALARASHRVGVDAHRGNAKRFIVRADEMLTAFV